jgi:uncharacterized peroxidase-related enzyme
MARAVKEDYRSAPLDDPTRALLDFAHVVTTDVHKVSPQVVDGLRRHGFNDGDILDAAHIVGFFNYYSRLADALGVDPEPDMPPS